MIFKAGNKGLAAEALVVGLSTESTAAKLCVFRLHVSGIGGNQLGHYLRGFVKPIVKIVDANAVLFTIALYGNRVFSGL